MEEIKRNPLPKLECGMAYLAHPYTSTSHSPGQYTSPQLIQASLPYAKAKGIRIYAYRDGLLYSLE